MKGLKIIVLIAALVLITGAISDAWAGCSPSRRFRSQGKPNETANIRFSVVGVQNTGNTIGRMWDSDDANNSNSGLTGPNFGSQCPPSAFWLPQASEMKIDEFHGSTTCSPAGCPADNMTVVVEDFATAGPPGINDTAYYAAFMVYETPTADRWWDYGLIDGLASGSVVPMLAFPDVVVGSQSRNGNIITVNYMTVDQSSSVHTWDTPNSQVFPTDRVISEWQLVQSTGTSDPGRLRSAGWVTIQTTPYVPGGVPKTADVVCQSTVTDEYIAIGLGFNGGAAGVIDSALVGRAWILECDPNIADPEFPVNLDRKHSATQLEAKPGHTGGRR